MSRYIKSSTFSMPEQVVFGKVIDGILTLRKIENVATGPNNRPKLTVKITGMVDSSAVTLTSYQPYW